MWLRVNQEIPTNPGNKPFSKHCGKKEENAGDQHFLLFSTVFSTILETKCITLFTTDLSSVTAFDFV